MYRVILDCALMFPSENIEEKMKKECSTAVGSFNIIFIFFFFRLRREDLRVCDIFSSFYTADLLFELFTHN